jgi:N-methylhydantoinase A
MAPVAGRHLARREAQSQMAIVADTGGTSFDVSLVRRDRIPWTRETWLGPRFRGHMTGFPSVDVKSIGAGGGSIARVDDGGLLQVGPESAGADPGPVCYGRGGQAPTVTDCALVLGYLDPAFFLGGAIRLDAAAARVAVERVVARPLGMSAEEAAAAVMAVATESMVAAIEEITVNQGIDPRGAALVGGGGAAGFNAVAIARRLGCAQLLVPAVGAALSAVGALLSDLSTDRARVLFMRSDALDIAAVNAVLAELADEAAAFARGPGAGAVDYKTEFVAEARYPQQTWEIEVPLRQPRFDDEGQVRQLVEDFHALHRELYAVDDPTSSVELVTWRVRVHCRLQMTNGLQLAGAAAAKPAPTHRTIYLRGAGRVSAALRRLDHMSVGETIAGPAIVESNYTTVLLDDGAAARRLESGSLLITP